MQTRTESGLTVRVRALDDHDRPPRRFPSGRVCAEYGCDTRLSIYNEGTCCSKHNLSVKPRLRGKKVN
jgi:hypothetical protein